MGINLPGLSLPEFNLWNPKWLTKLVKIIPEDRGRISFILCGVAQTHTHTEYNITLGLLTKCSLSVIFGA